VAKGKAKTGKTGKAGKGKGRAAEGGGPAKQKLPKGSRPGLVDRLAVLVGIAFAASLAWQHLPL